MWSISGLMFSHKEAQKAHKEDQLSPMSLLCLFVAVFRIVRFRSSDDC